MEKNNAADLNLVDVSENDLQVGVSYPIYGAITKIFYVSPGGMLVEINHKLRLHMNVTDKDAVERIKARAFDFGIFVTTITEVGAQFEGECTQVIFGKPQEFSV